MKKQTGNETEIDSIHIAAYLISRNIPLMRMQRIGRMGIFSFDSEKASPEIQVYMSGQATIEPKAFISAIRILKQKIDECPMDKSDSIAKMHYPKR